MSQIFFHHPPNAEVYGQAGARWAALSLDLNQRPEVKAVDWALSPTLQTAEKKDIPTGQKMGHWSGRDCLFRNSMENGRAGMSFLRLQPEGNVRA